MTAMPDKPKGLFSWYLSTNLLTRILVGLIAGAIVGIILGIISAGTPAPNAATTFVQYTRFFGDLFIRLLKMIVVPVVFFSLVGGAASIAPANLGRVGAKIMIYYILTSAFAVVIGLILANMIKPGFGFHVAGDPSAKVAANTAPSLSAVLLNIVPTNPIESLAKGDILPIIFFAILFGIGISIIKDSASPALAAAARSLDEIISAAAAVMYKIVSGVMQYAPFGVFFLIAIVFAEQGPKAIGELLLVTITAYLGMLLHLAFCYGGILALFGLGLPHFVKKANEAMVTGFVTRTSSGTLPITMRVCEDNLGAPRSIASFSLPLGATINMDGTAIYLGVCAMFIGYACDMPLTFTQQTTVVITATLASIGTAGVPGAGAIMLLMVMDSINLPIAPGTNLAAAYSMILGIDALLDMGRTSLNITGDMVGTVVVAKSEKDLDMEAWNAPMAK